jgi:hypothetical protein
VNGPTCTSWIMPDSMIPFEGFTQYLFGHVVFTWSSLNSLPQLTRGGARREPKSYFDNTHTQKQLYYIITLKATLAEPVGLFRERVTGMAFRSSKRNCSSAGSTTRLLLASSIVTNLVNIVVSLPSCRELLCV